MITKKALRTQGCQATRYRRNGNPLDMGGGYASKRYDPCGKTPTREISCTLVDGLSRIRVCDECLRALEYTWPEGGSYWQPPGRRRKEIE